MGYSLFAPKHAVEQLRLQDELIAQLKRLKITLEGHRSNALLIQRQDLVEVADNCLASLDRQITLVSEMREFLITNYKLHVVSKKAFDAAKEALKAC